MDRRSAIAERMRRVAAACTAVLRRKALLVALLVPLAAACTPGMAAVVATPTGGDATARTTGLDPAFGATSKDIWIPRHVVRALPTTGAAWQDLAADATGAWGSPLISDQESYHDVRTLAGALYAVRMNDTGMRTKVVNALEAAVGTEDGGRTLALGRNLTGYVIAADLVGHRSARFVGWVRSVRHETLEGRTLVSTHEDRPNNWGTHAGAARMAADLYVGDTADFARAISVFRGFLGDRTAYASFRYGALTWQGDESRPVGINRPGAVKAGISVDGAIPDDQRRCECPVQNPIAKENYAWEGMQGILAQATIAAGHGHPDVWSWSDAAIRRATRFLYVNASFPAVGDDQFVPYLIDAGYGTTYSNGVDARNGKSIGYTDWTHSPTARSIARG